jgi:S1-C subfamily serine protease
MEVRMASALIDFSNQLAEAVEQAGKSVVVIPEGGQRGVSGTVWRSGIVVAAEHTIRGRQEISVILPTGETTKATVAGRDATTDIVVLKLTSGSVMSASLADLAQLRVGHPVLAIGRRRQEGLCASYGIVSAIGGEWRTWQGGRIEKFLRLDLLPFSGFSGGPLIDVQGQVLGINTSGPRRSMLTIPRTTVDRVVTQLLEKGHIARGYLGAGLQPVQLPASARKGAAEKYEGGLLIVTIAPDGPAEKAGLLLGDILLALDGTSVSEPSEVQAALDAESVGKTLSALVLRGGKPVESRVSIAERPRRA